MDEDVEKTVKSNQIDNEKEVMNGEKCSKSNTCPKGCGEMLTSKSVEYSEAPGRPIVRDRMRKKIEQSSGIDEREKSAEMAESQEEREETVHRRETEKRREPAEREVRIKTEEMAESRTNGLERERETMERDTEKEIKREIDEPDSQTDMETRLMAESVERGETAGIEKSADTQRNTSAMHLIVNPPDALIYDDRNVLSTEERNKSDSIDKNKEGEKDEDNQGMEDGRKILSNSSRTLSICSRDDSTNLRKHEEEEEEQEKDKLHLAPGVSTSSITTAPAVPTMTSRASVPSTSVVPLVRRPRVHPLPSRFPAPSGPPISLLTMKIAKPHNCPPMWHAPKRKKM